MRIPDNISLSRSEWEKYIDEWVFDSEHRQMLKSNLLDGMTYEEIAEQLYCSRDKVARLMPKLKDRLFMKIK